MNPQATWDTATSATLHGMIKDFAKTENQTFVIMTHDPSLACSADRVGKLEYRSLVL